MSMCMMGLGVMFLRVVRLIERYWYGGCIDGDGVGGSCCGGGLVDFYSVAGSDGFALGG